MGFITSGRGLVLTIGSLAGITAWFLGFINQQSTGKRMKALSEEMASAGVPPQAAQIAEMKSLAEKLSKDGILSTILVSIALISMSITEYISF